LLIRPAWKKMKQNGPFILNCYRNNSIYVGSIFQSRLCLLLGWVKNIKNVSSRFKSAGFAPPNGSFGARNLRQVASENQRNGRKFKWERRPRCRQWAEFPERHFLEKGRKLRRMSLQGQDLSPSLHKLVVK